MTTNYDTARLLRIIVAITYDNNVRVIPSRDTLCYNVSIIQIIRYYQYATCTFANDSSINNNRDWYESGNELQVAEHVTDFE